MSLFVIGDLHLCCSVDKPMDIFGGWENYMERLQANWQALVSPEDTVVMAGDLCWALKLEEAEADLRFLEALPGQKLLLKGNHDYWWSTRTKMEAYFASLGLKTVGILHNNAVQHGEQLLCASRGWLFENGAPHDRKIVERECCRIKASLDSAQQLSPTLEKILFLHYPPVYREQELPEFLELMEQYEVRRCYYGHLHGAACQGAWQGSYRGVEFRLVSADYLGFTPLKIG
ncbi:MAG: metallophosphoesterase [Angelakisella sp.]